LEERNIWSVVPRHRFGNEDIKGLDLWRYAKALPKRCRAAHSKEVGDSKGLDFNLVTVETKALVFGKSNLTTMR